MDVSAAQLSARRRTPVSNSRSGAVLAMPSSSQTSAMNCGISAVARIRSPYGSTRLSIGSWLRAQIPANTSSPVWYDVHLNQPTALRTRPRLTHLLQHDINTHGDAPYWPNHGAPAGNDVITPGAVKQRPQLGMTARIAADECVRLLCIHQPTQRSLSEDCRVDELISKRLIAVERLAWSKADGTADIRVGPVHMHFEGGRGAFFSGNADWRFDVVGTRAGDESWLAPFQYDIDGGRWTMRDAADEPPLRASGVPGWSHGHLCATRSANR